MNKRAFFTFLIIMTVLGCGYSQKFTMGVRVGGSLNWAAFGDKNQKDTFSTKIFQGYYGGVQIGFPLKDNFGFFAEAGYAKRGRRLTFEDGYDWENKTFMHMAEVTMLLRRNFRFQIDKNIPGEWFVNIGPEIDYWFSGSGEVIVDDGTPFPYTIGWNEAPTNDYNVMYYDDVNRWLFGLMVGVGVKAPLRNNQRLAIDLRFVSGHTFLGKTNSSSSALFGFYDTMKTNMKSVNLSVTYFLDFDVQKGRMGKSTIDKKKR